MNSKQGTLPWHLQSFLQQKVFIKDQKMLAKIKNLMNTRKPKKPKTSHYNQDALRFHSQAKTRQRELPDTFLGAEFSPLMRRTYEEQVERMSRT